MIPDHAHWISRKKKQKLLFLYEHFNIIFIAIIIVYINIHSTHGFEKCYIIVYIW